MLPRMAAAQMGPERARVQHLDLDTGLVPENGIENVYEADGRPRVTGHAARVDPYCLTVSTAPSDDEYADKADRTRSVVSLLRCVWRCECDR